MIKIRDRVDIIVRMIFGGLVFIGCFMVVKPFLTAILLSAILAVVSWPMYQKAQARLFNNRTVAAGFMVSVMVVTVLIPLSILFAILAQQIPPVVYALKNWVSAGMPLPAWLTGLPYVGPFIAESMQHDVDIVAVTGFLQKTFDPVSRWILSLSLGVSNGLLQLVLVAFISFFFYRDGDALARRVGLLLDKVGGGLSAEYSNILVNTTRSVVFGIIGTAIGQGLVAAVGFFIAGVPGIVLLSFLVCLLSVVPVGPPLVWGPAAVWLFAHGNTGWAIFLVLWGALAVSSVDNFLKPVLISRGTSLPIALVFLGVFGGILSFGFLGIVLGPILLSAAISMFQAWVYNPRKNIRKILAGGPGRKSAKDEGGEQSRQEELFREDGS